MYYSVFNICTEQTTWYIISHKGNASYNYNVILMDIIKKRQYQVLARVQRSYSAHSLLAEM